MNRSSDIERKLQQCLLGQGIEGDRLMLSDGVLRSALDGKRKLTLNERAALEQSPLTARRLRQLSIERAHAARAFVWNGSFGMLRAAATDAPLSELATDDGYWSLHFVAQADAWQVIIKLAADAPFAHELLREQTLLRVLDGSGAVIMQGRLDNDGEYETAWPFDSAPAPHFQACGARFTVAPVHN